MNIRSKISGMAIGYVLLILAVAAATALVTALLVNIFERKSEGRSTYTQLVELTEDDTDPEKWAVNWPRQYDSYLKTALATSTRFGGHGGSEALPDQKSDMFPWLTRMFQGYAFSIDYRDRRGQATFLAPWSPVEDPSKCTLVPPVQNT